MVQFRLLLKPLAEVLKSSLAHNFLLAHSDIELKCKAALLPASCRLSHGHLHYVKVPNIKSNRIPGSTSICEVLLLSVSTGFQ